MPYRTSRPTMLQEQIQGLFAGRAHTADYDSLQEPPGRFGAVAGQMLMFADKVVDATGLIVG